ncbi:MAG: hypothetical protein Q8N77_03270 [Nanoarchaeota archaeon]|nr:hypothetical protein [Nanoarchaeota archaeon]
MDKYQATRILTEKLAEHFGRLVISDEQYKEKLVEGSQHVYVVGNPIDLCLDRDFPVFYYTRKNAKGKEQSTNLEEVIKDSIPSGTNYLFLWMKKLSDCRFFAQVTPYSIIGSKEADAVKKLFYKNDDVGIREAVGTLGIKDFYRLYKAYLNNSKKFYAMLFNGDFENLKKEVVAFSQSLSYDSSEETRLSQFEEKFGIKKLNSDLSMFGVEFTLPSAQQVSWLKKHRVEKLVDMLNKHIPPLDEKNTLNIEFLRFVFEMPYEDQNVEVNKFLLKNFSHFLDIDLVMLREYQTGRHFNEYFELLDKDRQEGIVSMVKRSGIKNESYNVFLWSQGFKDIDLDYLKFYKEDATGFIAYFSSRSPEEKKFMIRDVMGCDFVNEEVVKWLNDNETDLVREVGFNE